MSSDPLPKFKRPPVVETVLGVQFEPVAGFGNGHLGAFWRGLGDDWCNVSDAAPLDPQFERFEGKTWGSAGLELKLSRDIHLRLQIRNKDKSRMIQVQNGRLHYNWLGHGGYPYPSYDKVRPEFDRTLDLFARFLEGESLGELRPNQWEITYVNHMPRGTVWNEPKDWSALFPSSTSLHPLTGQVHLESFSGEWHYEIRPQRGRLHAAVRHGWRKEPESDMLVLNLTARGSAQGENALSVGEGLALGHETIVRSFRDLTSNSAHQYWGLFYDED